VDDAGSPHRFYRLVKFRAVRREDFFIHKQLGIPLRARKLEDLWSRGISVFPTIEDARATAVRLPAFQDGYIACLEIHPDANVHIEQTGRWPHFTIYDADPDLLLSFVKGEAVPVRDEP
jgi:hypothetical protein